MHRTLTVPVLRRVRAAAPPRFRSSHDRAPARARGAALRGGRRRSSPLLAWLGPPGTDLAAHAYQRTLFLEHGFTLWNNFWYAGRYSFVTYSVLYYPLAALLGIRLLAVATIALAALAFAVVLVARVGTGGALVEPHVRGRLGRDRALGRVPVRARDGARAARALGAAGAARAGASPRSPC